DSDNLAWDNSGLVWKVTGKRHLFLRTENLEESFGWFSQLGASQKRLIMRSIGDVSVSLFLVIN
ncbi:hypothetical protein, partial [Acidithiobacillus caldus]